MEITNEVELWSLIRQITETKFICTEYSLELAGSPFLSIIVNRAWESFVKTHLFRKLDAAGNIETWRLLDSNRQEWKTICSWINRTTDFQKWSEATRKKYICDLASPFIISELDIISLL